MRVFTLYTRGHTLYKQVDWYRHKGYQVPGAVHLDPANGTWLQAVNSLPFPRVNLSCVWGYVENQSSQVVLYLLVQHPSSKETLIQANLPLPASAWAVTCRSAALQGLDFTTVFVTADALAFGEDKIPPGIQAVFQLERLNFIDVPLDLQ